MTNDCHGIPGHELCTCGHIRAVHWRDGQCELASPSPCGCRAFEKTELCGKPATVGMRLIRCESHAGHDGPHWYNVVIMPSLACRCKHDIAAHVEGHGCTARLDDKSECECNGFVERVAARRYSYSLHLERDASPAVQRLVSNIGSTRYEGDFTQNEFRAYRDGLSAVGILIIDVETWNETPHQTVL